MYHIYLNYLNDTQDEVTSEDLDLIKEQINCLAEIIVNLLMKENYVEPK